MTSPSLYDALSSLGGLGMVRGPIRAVQYMHFAVCVLAGHAEVGANPPQRIRHLR